jgi:hypothetical protein
MRRKRHQGRGRRRLDDRAVLAAILYVLQTGCIWSDRGRSGCRLGDGQGPYSMKAATPTIGSSG